MGLVAQAALICYGSSCTCWFVPVLFYGFWHCYVLQVETREDEEQNVKLQETIELLLAAGYFRARIKGLSPFDKASF